MKVNGQNGVTQIITALINNIRKAVNTQKPMFASAIPSYGKGIMVENPQIAALERYFQFVPPFEYNFNQENLIINGPLMGGAIEELLEV